MALGIQSTLPQNQGEERTYHAQIDEDRKRCLPDAYRVQTFRDYAFGLQKNTLSEDQKKVLEGLLKNTFCDNVCRRIVTTVASRVKLERVDVANSATVQFFQELWTLNWFRMLTRRVHTTAIRDGNTYVSLGWDNVSKRATVRRELAWNGKRGVFMAFDDFGGPVYAVKEWEGFYKLEGDATPIKYKRRVIWEAGRIGRFIQRAGGWQWFTLPELRDPVTNEVIREAEKPNWQEWKEEDGTPLGIPCVQFARMDHPKDGSGEELGAGDNYGNSILDGGVLGIQDAINDDHYSILSAARFTAYQMIFVSGVKMKDAENRPVVLKLIPGTILHVEDKEAKATTLGAGTMDPLIKTLETHHKAAARSTNTPIHVISGEWPSGVALIEADRPLVEQVRALCDSFAPSWASVFNKAARISNRFGGTNYDTKSLVNAVFEQPEGYDFLTRVTYATQLSPFVSNREALRLLGRYTEEQIEKIIKEKKDELGMFMLPDATGASGTSGGTGAVDPAKKETDQGEQ